MAGWFNNLSKENQAALIGAAVAMLSIIVKDFIIDRLKESRKQKKTEQSTFRAYSNPIVKSCESLAFRLREILQNRAGYLLGTNPQNEFFEYKYQSTVYRLCGVVAWIRAVQREFAYLDLPSKKNNSKIEKAFMNFQSALADGQHLELSIFNEIVKLWGINITSLSKENRVRLAIKMEEVVYSRVNTRKILKTSDLSIDDQITLLRIIADMICEKAGCEKILDGVLHDSRGAVIEEISRVEAWLYRDWQNAIGDLFLIKIDGHQRRFDLMGYGDFEKKFKSEDSDSIWLRRVEKIFNGLDVEADDRLDARVKQLKNIYTTNLDLLIAFNGITGKNKAIPNQNLDELLKFKLELEGRATSDYKCKLTMVIKQQINKLLKKDTNNNH